MTGDREDEAPYGGRGFNWALPALATGVILGLPAVWDSADWADICGLVAALALAVGGSELARLLDTRRAPPAIRGRTRIQRSRRARERRGMLSVIPIPTMICGLIAGFLAVALTNSVLLGGLAIVAVSTIIGTLFRQSQYAGESVGTRSSDWVERRTPRGRR